MTCEAIPDVLDFPPNLCQDRSPRIEVLVFLLCYVLLLTEMSTGRS